jgi:hypothetical protein
VSDPQNGEDLQSTSDSISGDAEALARIEERKRALPDGDPDLVRLSVEAEEIARGLVPKVVAEREIAAEVVADGS